MKAIHYVKTGDAVEGLEVREVDDPPPPGPADALVAVEYAPINMNDLMVVWGIYHWKPTPPEIIGNEGMGRVLSVGSDVRGVKPGDRVVLPFMSRTWRERLVVPADQLVALPQDADPHQAAMLAINGVTAHLLLQDFVTLQEGDAIIFNAATSGIARWFLALAAQRGLRTVGLVRRQADVEKVRQAGCDIVIADDEPLEAARARLAGLSVPLALDCIGGASSGRLAQLLSAGGTLVTFGNISRTPMEVPAGPLIFRNIRLVGFFEGLSHNASRVVDAVRSLSGMIGPDGVRQPVAALYPMTQIKDAVAHALRGGRILLEISEPGLHA
jgi:NADPH:quinone reductase-like Zn-dependent oxidoreductase